MKSVLFIGGQGMLGRPVVRRLVAEGFACRALARQPERARAKLPPQVEVVAGDVASVDDIRRAAEGMEVVYLNLATHYHRARFRPELDGTRNTLVALGERKEILIAKISALGLRPGIAWADAAQKYEAEEEIKRSGHPHLLLRPSWFMESLPLFHSNGKFILFGRLPHAVRWIAGDDLGAALAAALKKGLADRTFNLQGPEDLTFDQAAARYLAAVEPAARIIRFPLWPLRLGAPFHPPLKDFVRLMDYTAGQREEFASQETWDELGAPRLKIEDYAAYMKRSGDRPSKKPGAA
jgi:uncharacterized protein YbjT (DUF2867 family)